MWYSGPKSYAKFLTNFKKESNILMTITENINGAK